MMYYLLVSGIPGEKAAQTVYPKFGIKRKAGWVDDLRGKVPDVEHMVIRTALKNGTVDTILLKLADFVEETRGIMSSFRRAMILPVVELFVALAIFMFMMGRVVPEIMKLGKEMGVELPAVSMMVFSVGEFIKNYFLIVVLVLAALFYYAINNFPQLVMAVPFLRKILFYKEKALLFLSLALSLESGMSFLNSLKYASDVELVDVEKILRELDKGRNISEAFAPVLEDEEYMIMKAGEQTGKLDECLRWISRLNQDRFVQSLNYVSSLLQPLIIVLLGVGVFFVLISIYLPIFNFAARF